MSHSPAAAQPSARSRGRRRPAPRLRHCAEGKVRFPDHESAVGALHSAASSRSRIEAEGGECRRHERRAYECAICRGWHLTSKRSVEAPRRMADAAVFLARPAWAPSRRHDWATAA